MSEHSNTLETTALWKAYQEKASSHLKRCLWIKEVYETAVTHLKDVRQVFKNYTLHDETHVLNVLDAMGGLLGDSVSSLSIGEMELLILAASLHDLGMVYTDEEIEACFSNESAYKNFLRENRPDLLGCAPKDWTKDIQQWYLRTLHPFRIPDVLQNDEWRHIFNSPPKETVSKQCILAVCQAHGEKIEEIISNKHLDYLNFCDTDPRFCAILLRLADLLDFDDTRAPQVLYSYVKCNEKSREEWDKHQASAGFRYPISPSTNDLPYKACCKNPSIEHAIRDFLDWIDEEFANASRLQKHCHPKWQCFSFPRAVLRNEIESDGYMSGDFCLTMDQEQILNLLMGENLYGSHDVFVRELLQNAMDAVLLRGEMDSSFNPEKSRIDFWEWSDKEGNLWFRIDDEGTGMTLGMLQRYFLKVGNSYYTSKELERDLRDHGQVENYQGISRFGIGFLSCFLCGDYAEVSTLYYDPQKNRRENPSALPSPMTNYGLRLQVTGLTGYYTLKNQSEYHLADNLPMPDFYHTKNQKVLEQNGYRIKPGTSILIRLNPGKLGALNLRNTVEEYLCAAKMPVYYNNKRVGRTYAEAMQIVHELEGEKTYEFSPELKKKFDDCFPAVRGQYPKLLVTTIPLDKEVGQVLPDLSGVLMKYNIQFEQPISWQFKDFHYTISTAIVIESEKISICLISHNIDKVLKKTIDKGTIDWSNLEIEYGIEKVSKLEKKMETFTSCPKEEDLGELWSPFSKFLNLHQVWKAYCDYCNKTTSSFDFTECEYPSIYRIFGNYQLSLVSYAYKGVVINENEHDIPTSDLCALFLLDKKCKPNSNISRSQILDMPMEISIIVNCIMQKYKKQDSRHSLISSFTENNFPLYMWKKVCTDSLQQWMIQNLRDIFKEQQLLQKPKNLSNNEQNSTLNKLHPILRQYLKAYFQINYFMTLNFEKGQLISFHEKVQKEREELYDIFPPMMFCKADSDQSRQYICHATSHCRRGITEDHPFIIWLLENSSLLKKYFQRQFKQIIDYLCNQDAVYIIKTWNKIREQLLSLSNHYNINVSSLPQLTMDDFWSKEKLECPF